MKKNKYDSLIEKLNELKKNITVPNVSSNRRQMNSLGAGWSQDTGTGTFHHDSLGQITTAPHKSGGYEIRHNKGIIGRTKTIEEAGSKIKQYVDRLGPNMTNMYSTPSVGTSHMGQPAPNVVRKSESGQYTAAQLAAIEEAEKLKKNATNAPWTAHSDIPSAHVTNQKDAVKVENAAAVQLANLLNNKSMLNAPIRQPTDDQMFGHLVPSEEVVKSAEDKWNNTMNWLQEASKPISSRFSSEEEEKAYWESIKVADRDDGSAGY